MEKKYFGETYYFTCPNCKKQTMGVAYFGLFSLPEMGKAREAGLFSYRCKHCKKFIASDKARVNGEVREVSKDEAIKQGLIFESGGLA